MFKRCSGSPGGPNWWRLAAKRMAIVMPSESILEEPPTREHRPRVSAASCLPKRLTKRECWTKPLPINFYPSPKLKTGPSLQLTIRFDRTHIGAIWSDISKAVKKVLSGNSNISELHPTVVYSIQALPQRFVLRSSAHVSKQNWQFIKGKRLSYSPFCIHNHRSALLEGSCRCPYGAKAQWRHGHRVIWHSRSDLRTQHLLWLRLQWNKQYYELLREQKVEERHTGVANPPLPVDVRRSVDHKFLALFVINSRCAYSLYVRSMT